MKAGWEVKPLGEVCTLQRGFDLPKRLRTSGPFPLVTSNGPTDTHDTAKVIGPGVATGRSGTIGNVHFIEDDFWPLNTALYVKDFHGNDEKYVWYLLQAFDLSQFASGAGVPTLNRNHVHGEMISTTSKLEEQKQIVAVLDAAFEGLTRAKENAEANLQNARELFEAQLKAQFEPLPKGWTISRLEKICSKIGSGATPRGGKNAYKGEGISLVRSLNIHDREFRHLNLAFIDDDQADKLSNVIVEAKDVLLNITGASVARCSLVDDDVLPARVNQHVAIIRPHPDTLSPDFLCYELTSEPFKKALLKTGEEGGATRQAITKAQIQALKVSYPNDLAEQNAICGKLAIAEGKAIQLEEFYRTKLTDIADLRQSLLQKAFAGALT